MSGSLFNSASLTSLFSTLFTTFGVIAIGYASKRTGYFSREAKAGLGELVGKVALPALLFRAIATLQLSDLKAEFIVGVLVAKVTLFVVTIGTAKMVGRGLADQHVECAVSGSAAHRPGLLGLRYALGASRQAGGRLRCGARPGLSRRFRGSQPAGRRSHLGPLRLQL